MFWKTIAVLLSVIGALYLPADIEGLPEATRPVLDIITKIERETYLWGLVVIFGTWIIWTEIRPQFQKWIAEIRATKTGAFGSQIEAIFPNEINDEAKYGPNKQGTTYFPERKSQDARPINEIQYSIGVKNNSRINTLRRVHLVVEYVSKLPRFPNVTLPMHEDPSSMMADLPPQKTTFFLFSAGVNNSIFEGTYV